MKKLESVIALVIVIVFAAVGYNITDTPREDAKSSASPEIHFLNVGQGDSILIQEKNNQVLIDGGPDGAVLNQLGKVMPVSDREIETVVLSHPHADHLRGLLFVLRNYQVGKVLFNGVSYNTPEFKEFLDLINQKAIPTERLYAGKMFEESGINYTTVWPPRRLSNIPDVNNSSVVLIANCGLSRVLFLGDVSSEYQNKFLGELGSVDILKVSHHGSKTGTAENLIEATKPQYAVIQVGRNSYGHPAPSVLALLGRTKILRTDQLGTISFGIGKEGVLLY